MYNNIDEVPQEVQDRADEFFKWQEQYVNKYKTESSELHKNIENDFFEDDDLPF